MMLDLGMTFLALGVAHALKRIHVAGVQSLPMKR